MFAPGVTFMNKEFGNTSSTLTSLVVSVYVLGWAVGPLVLSPLSEIYGRRRIMDFGNWFFVVWQIGCALAPNLNSLIVFRFLAGIGGSTIITIGGGVIADLFAPEQRGSASAAFAMGPLFGPVVGPICGGFIAQRVGWRWVYWILLIAGTLVSAGMTVFGDETNPETLLARKTERLRKETNNPNLISWYDRDREIKPPAVILKHGLIRPLKMLVKSPICALMCIYMSTVYGVLYLLFTSATLVFGWQYQFSPETSGLAYLGFGVGFFLGLAIQATISDKMLVKLAARNNGVAEPEMRLPLCAAFSIFIPIALFWYGWSAEKQAHWIVPIIGMVPFGIGMMGVFLPVQTYMIDAFPNYAASAIAALTATRSLVGAFLPMAGTPMYQAIGLGWGNSVLAFASLFLGGCVFLLYKYVYPLNYLPTYFVLTFSSSGSENKSVKSTQLNSTKEQRKSKKFKRKAFLPFFPANNDHSAAAIHRLSSSRMRIRL